MGFLKKSLKYLRENSSLMVTEVPAKQAVKFHDAQKGKNNRYSKKPAFGSVVYCQLGPVEHSGIYVGNNEIVQLNGKGKIEKVGLKGFTSNITTVDPTIWFPCDDESGLALGLD